MKMTGTRPWRSLLITALMLAAFSVASYSSPDKRQPKAYRDVSAIGHRDIGNQKGLGNWYSLEKEKQIGAHCAIEAAGTVLLPTFTRFADWDATCFRRSKD